MVLHMNQEMEPFFQQFCDGAEVATGLEIIHEKVQPNLAMNEL